MLALLSSLLQVQAGSLSRDNKRIQDEKSGPAFDVDQDCEMVGGG